MYQADGTFKVRVTLELDLDDGWDDCVGETEEAAREVLREVMLEHVNDWRNYKLRGVGYGLTLSDHDVVLVDEDITVRKLEEAR